MVNCKNCGAPLSLDNAYCPHCGTANPEAQEHLKKLAKLDSDYKKTKFDVLNEVKKNKSGYGLLTILVIILLANLLLIPLHASSYEIADRITASKMPVDDVKKQLNNYLDNKQYTEFVTCYDKYAVEYSKYREYNRIYYLSSSFVRIKECISDYYFGKDLYTDMLIRGCHNIKEYKDDYDRYKKKPDSEQISSEYFTQLNDELDLFLQSFLNLSDEDIDSISSISESELLVLVNRRLSNEE